MRRKSRPAKVFLRVRFESLDINQETDGGRFWTSAPSPTVFHRADLQRNKFKREKETSRLVYWERLRNSVALRNTCLFFEWYLSYHALIKKRGKSIENESEMGRKLGLVWAANCKFANAKKVYFPLNPPPPRLIYALATSLLLLLKPRPFLPCDCHLRTVFHCRIRLPLSSFLPTF